MKNLILLILTILLTAWCSHTYIMHPWWYNFALCLVSAMLVGCWAMIVVDDVKKCLKDEDEGEKQ